MLLQKKSTALLMACTLGLSGTAFADGVFLGRSMAAHPLTDAESSQMDSEFVRQFGNPAIETAAKSSNPWDAKKKTTQAQKKATWGECRDYALQLRNQCYKEGREAYACERFYEARSLKCDSKY